MKKPQTAWVIKDPSGHIIIGSARTYRTNAINKYVQLTLEKWASLRSYGWRCVKVLITEIEKK